MDSFSEYKQDVNRLEERLIALNQLMRKHRDYIEFKYKISALEMDLIQFVVNSGPQKMKAISMKFFIKLSTLTSIIDKAERKRILKRVNSREDRRVVFLEATKKGNQIFQSYQALVRNIAVKMQSELGEEEFQRFVSAIETFTDRTTSE